jgi:hypothetical protein
LETEFIRDQAGGAATVKFSELSVVELRQRVWSFPEAYAEYMKIFINEQQQQGLIPKSG